MFLIFSFVVLIGVLYFLKKYNTEKIILLPRDDLESICSHSSVVASTKISALVMMFLNIFLSFLSRNKIFLTLAYLLVALGYVSWFVAVIAIVAFMYFSLRRFSKWSRENVTNQFDQFPDVRKSATFKDPTLLEEMWNYPVAAAYRNQQPFYQPCSGYCGFASVNTLLQSVPHASHRLKYGWSPRHINASEMEVILDKALSQTPLHGLFRTVEVFRADSMTEDDWQNHLLSFNDVRFRYLALFHRAHLFFNSSSDATTRQGSNQVFFFFIFLMFNFFFRI